MIFFSLLSALLTRLLFCLHVFVSVGLVVLHSKQPLYWCFLIGIIFMIIEMIFVMVKRKGEEYKLFWPSCFLYLSTMLPVIWIMELDLLEHRLDEQHQLMSALNESSTLKIRGLDIKSVLNSDVAAKKVGELGVVVLIIIGRWLLPRGQLSRDQLSALLLGYIGMGADILDLFSSLSHVNVSRDVTMHYITLAVFSWSMLQFCITATVTAGIDDTENEVQTGKADEECETRGQPSSTNSVDGNSSDRLEHDNSPAAEIGTPKRKFVLSADILQILIPLLMQDGPFMILRLVLLIKFGVANEIHIYFTGKNALTVVLLLYRLYGIYNDQQTGRRVDPQGFHACSGAGVLYVKPRKNKDHDQQLMMASVDKETEDSKNL